MPGACRICGNTSDNRVHTAREMMFGTRDEFRYLECSRCGTLQIEDVPDLTKYYPENYYSFSAGPIELESSRKRILAAGLIGRYLVTGNGLIGRYLAEKKPHIAREFPSYLLEPELRLSFSSRIIDIGSGSGELLRKLEIFGFRSLTGADAFIASNKSLGRGIEIIKARPADLSGTWDVVMFNHSFEHMPDPGDALDHAYRIMADEGRCLIRIPVVNRVWELYGTDWVQLDPPRHLFLFTEKGFRMLAQRSGFDVIKVVYDSTAFQFSGSEQYRLQIPLHGDCSGSPAENNDVFTQEQIERWQVEAEWLNAEGRGDQACFYLKKAGSS